MKLLKSIFIVLLILFTMNLYLPNITFSQQARLYAEAQITQHPPQILAPQEEKIPIKRFPADWSLGRKAGPIRNRQMLVEGKPDVVYAFYQDKKKSKGTKNMAKQSKDAGILVVENQ